MLARLGLKYKKGSKNKWNKEVSLTVSDEDNPEGFTLKVRKWQLLEHSKFFRNIPEADFKKTRKINLDEVSIVALQKIVQYLETSSASFIYYTEALETLQAAHKYQLEYLMEICAHQLIAVLQSSNVCDIYDVSSTLKLNYLEHRCLQLIDKFAEEVLMSRGFMTLPKTAVREIIKRNSLNVDSELTVFHAVLGWSLNYSLKNGIDATDMEKFMPAVKSLFGHVRFAVMSEEELNDPEVHQYCTLLSSNEPWNKSRSMSNLSQTSSGSGELPERQPRHYIARYVHSLNTFESNLHTVKTGESFCLNIEILKGRVFLTGLTLGFLPFAATKSDACLYVVATATNILAAEEKTTRGTFLSTTEEACLKFATPVVAKASERLQIVLSVKRAENICPLAISPDVQIAMPESKTIAMKITPVVASSEEEEIGPCIFKEIEYFF